MGQRNADLSAEERLLAEKRDVLAELAAAAIPPDELGDGWQDRDSPAEDELRDVEYSHRGALRQRLLQIDRALEQIGAGTYGLCAKCGVEIDRKRLDKEPAVLLCISCQAATEADSSPPSM